MFKRLRILVVFLLIVLGGVAVVKWWLPGLLQGTSAVKLPPGVKPPGTPVTDEESLPVPVRTFKSSRIEFTDILPTLGTVRGQAEIELKFEVNGIVKSVDFREGDLVSRGQVLATLDDKDARLRVEYAEAKQKTAEAQLALVQKRLTIHEELFRLGAIIQAKLDEAKLEVEQAKSQVDTAKKEGRQVKWIKSLYFGNPLPIEFPKSIINTFGKMINFLFPKNRFLILIFCKLTSK